LATSSGKNKKTAKTQCAVKTSQRNTKYYDSKTTETVLSGLVLGETVGYEGSQYIAIFGV